MKEEGILMKMRKLVASLAAAATLFGGLAFGVGAANAADAPKIEVNDKNVVTSEATFKFTSDDADQWGNNNNRVIKAYKIGDYVKYGTGDDAFYTVATPTDPKNASSTLKNALETALKGKGANGTDLTVPTDQKIDPLAWALQNGYLDQSVQAPYVEENGAKYAGTTRKFADALKDSVGEDDVNFATTTLKVNANTANGEVVLTEVKDTTGKSYTASLPAGIYLFLDVTGGSKGTANATDPNWIENGKENVSDSGKVVVNSAPIILFSGSLGTGVDDKGVIKDPIGTADSNTIDFKNRVTPVTKSHDDADNTVSEGQIVRYTLGTTFPAFTTGYTNYQFSLKDYPGVGQTVNLDGFQDESGQPANGAAYEVKVYDNADKAGNPETLNVDNSFTLTTSADNNGHEIVGATNDAAWFKLNFANLVRSKDYQTKYAGKYVEVTYAVKITAKTDPVTNKVEVNDNNSTATDQTKLTLGQFSFTKTDAQGNALAGAQFTIAAKNGDENAVTPAIKTATSDNDGTVTFTGLADGVYTVNETEVPSGYFQTAQASFEVTIKGGEAVYFDGTDGWGLAQDSGDSDLSGDKITDYAVKNVKNISELPKTGAAGIAMFTVIGLLLAGAAGTVYLKSRKANALLRA